MGAVFQNERQFFRKHGYLVLRGVFGPSTVSKLRTDITQMLESEPILPPTRLDVRRKDGTMVVRVRDVHKRVPSVARAMRTPILGQILSALMGNTAEVRLWHDQIFHKAGHTGGAVGWHQDYSYWQQAMPADLASVSIALTESNVDNGCLQVVPGSHEWGLVESTWGEFAADDPNFFLRHHLSATQQDQMTTVPLILKPGDVSFHHCLTLHGSMTNTTDEERLVYVAHCFPEHVVYRSDKRSLFQFPRIDVEEGGLIRGNDFPLLWAGHAPGMKALPAA